MIDPVKALDIREFVTGAPQAQPSGAWPFCRDLIRPGWHAASIDRWGRMAAGEEMHELTTETLDAILLERGFPALHGRMESLERAIDSALEQVVGLSARLQALEERLASQGVTRQAMLCDLGHESYSLKCPISVVVEEYDEETVARFPEVEAFASAATEGEAIALLKQDIIELYDELLASDEDELGKLPRQWRRVLSQLVQKDGPPQR